MYCNINAYPSFLYRDIRFIPKNTKQSSCHQYFHSVHFRLFSATRQEYQLSSILIDYISNYTSTIR